MGGLPLAVILLAVIFVEWDPQGAATAIQNFGFDHYITAAPWEDKPEEIGEGRDVLPDVLYVELDAPRYAAVPGSQWPRTDIARLVGKLKDAGARAVLFDEPFAQPDAASPDRFADALIGENAPSEIVSAIRQLPDPDAILSEALGSVRSISAIELGVDIPLSAAAIADPIEFDGVSPAAFLPAFDGAFTDMRVYADTANGAGIVSIPTKTDGIVRRMPLLFLADNEIFPSIALETLRLANDAPIVVKSKDTASPVWDGSAKGITHVLVGDYNIPTTLDGEIWLHPPGPSASVILSGTDILQGRLADQRLDNTLVFVGMKEARLSNYRLVDGRRVSRAQLHLLAYDQISSEHFVQRPAWAPRAEQAYIVIFGVLIWAAAAFTSVSLSAVVASIAIALPAYFGLIIFRSELMLFDFIIPCVTLILIFVTTAAWQAIHDQWMQQLVGNTDAPSPQAPLKTKIAQSAYRDTTIMVCSVRDMGKLAEHYQGSPFALGAIVNKTYDGVAQTVAKHGGQIIQTGDTLKAVWHTAQEPGTNATSACECSLEIVEKLEELNASLEGEFSYDGLSFNAVTLNIGIASGACIISQPRRRPKRNLSVYGAPMNLASRLCRRSEQYGPAIIVDNRTAELEGHQLAHLSLDTIASETDQTRLPIHALLGNAVVRASPRFREFNQYHRQLFAAVRGQLWEEAEHIVEKCRAIPGASPTLYDFYSEKIAHKETFAVGSRELSA